MLGTGDITPSHIPPPKMVIEKNYTYMFFPRFILRNKNSPLENPINYQKGEEKHTFFLRN